MDELLIMTLSRAPVLPRRTRSASSDAGPILLPPNLRTLGELPFTRGDRETLSAWLAEAGWPRGKMDIGTLEGYLVALLVWPVGVSSGAWLPPIWGEQGWKVPAKLASADAYARFIALVVGFLQELDRGLSASKPCLKPTLSQLEPALRRGSHPGIGWAQGFLRALQQSAQGLTGRSPAARSAAARIARHASFSTPSGDTDPAVAADLTSGVLTLAAERSSRGPLGALGEKVGDDVSARRRAPCG
jgi:yecA family protein